MLSAALKYATLGWSVFPIHGIDSGVCTCGSTRCSNPGKHPIFAKGHKIATNCEKQIHEWWKNHPNANIGVATGNVSGVFVIDLDVSPSKDGLSNFKSILARNTPLGPTLTALTGGGGIHLYFRMPNCEIKNSAGKIGAGIDVRGNGGYVIAPPSRHASGNAYKWESDNE